MNISLKQLRSGLSGFQIELLNLFWKYYLDNERWPTPLDIHRKYPKEQVEHALRSVGGQPSWAGNIVEQSHANNGPIYNLTLIGILLTKDGEKYESWLVGLLEFFRDKYYRGKKDDERLEFDDIEICNALKLNGTSRNIFGEITRYGLSLSIQSYSHTVGGNWKINRPPDVDGLPINGAVNARFEKLIFRYCVNPKWVFSSDRNIATTTVPEVATNFTDEANSFLDETPIEAATTPVNSKNNRSKAVKIFVSHSSDDKDLMEALTDLLRTAFSLPAKRIFCSSAAGHKLTGGDDTEKVLLDLLKDAQLLIGVLTPVSLQSSYVLFELGARWGLQLPLIPLVACGTKMGDLQDPLKAKHALNISEEGDALKLIEDVAKYLKQKPELPSLYISKVRQLVFLAQHSKNSEGEN